MIRSIWLARAGLLMAAVLLAVPAFAAQNNFPVRVLDADGIVQTECTLYLYTTDNELVQVYEPSADGTFVVDGAVGEKYVVGYQDRSNKGLVEITVPPGGGVDIQMPRGPVGNDNCADATDLGTAPASVDGSTSAATGDPEAGGTCGTSITAPGVWY